MNYNNSDAVLIGPSEGYADLSESQEFIGLGYIASYAEQKGFKVNILIPAIDNINEEDIPKIILPYKAAIVGISILFPTHVVPAINIVKHIKNYGLKCHITAGGHGATFLKEYLLSNNGKFDSVVCGEGEETFYNLLCAIKKNENWKKILGLAYLENNEIKINSTRPLINDLDKLPFPKRNYNLLNNKSYTPGISSSRGCYGSCSFCSVSSFYGMSKGKKWRARSPKNIVDEVEYLNNKGYRNFSFTDDNFLGPGNNGKSRATQIAEEIINRNIDINFNITTRSNDILNKRLLLMLKKAGLTNVFLGIESGVQEVLSRMNKKTTVKQNKDAIALLKELNIKLSTGFIMFDNETSINEVEENLRFIEETKIFKTETPILLLNKLWPIPGTPIEKKLFIEKKLYSSSKLDIVVDPRESNSYNNNYIKDGIISMDYKLKPDVEIVWKLLSHAYKNLFSKHEIVWRFLSAIDGGINATKSSPPEENSTALKKLKLWNQNLGILVKHLIKKSLEYAKDNDSAESGHKIILNMINSFDKRVLGKSFWDFYNKVNTNI